MVRARLLSCTNQGTHSECEACPTHGGILASHLRGSVLVLRGTGVQAVMVFASWSRAGQAED